MGTVSFRNSPCMACGTRDFQHSIRTAATKKRQKLANRVHRPCKLLANCEFALRGSDLFRSSEPETLMH